MTDVLPGEIESRMVQKKPTRVETVATTLRNEILLGSRYPRERLAELDLAEHHQVSRGTIREALQRLAAMGFVVGEPHRGYSVREFSHEDVVGLGEVFAMIELQAVRSIKFPVSSETVKIMRESAEQMAELDMLRDFDRFWELDRAFHGSLIAESKHPWLIDTWRRQQPFLSVITVPAILRPGVKYPGRVATERHLELLDAVLSGDAAVLRKAIEEHYHQHDNAGPVQGSTFA
jgi:DNA-binding GntR family transcriptional regulator